MTSSAGAAFAASTALSDENPVTGCPGAARQRMAVDPAIHLGPAL